MIKLFEERFTSIWENVIILAKEGKEDTKQSFQVQEKLCEFECQLRALMEYCQNSLALFY